MSLPVIAVDIDDTLFAHFEDLMNWYNETYDAHLTLADNHPKSTNEAWGTKTDEEAIKRVYKFYDTQVFKNAQPYVGAVQALKKLAERYELVFVTSRDYLLEQATHEWLQKYFKGSYTGVHFTAFYSLNGKRRSKIDVCRELGAAYIIDDALPACVDAVATGMKALLFGDYPWNSATELPEGIIRCHTWAEVEKQLL